MNNPLPSREEKQEFFSAYSFLLTIIHHNVISKDRFRKNNPSWGINIAYYSLVSVADLIIWITMKKKEKYHIKLIEIMKGEKRFYATKEWKEGYKNSICDERARIINKIDSQRFFEEPEDVLKHLGDILDSLSAIRTYNNYERYIISNQLRHEKLSDEFKRLIPIILDEIDKWLEYSFKIFINYIKTLSCFGNYLAVVTNKIEELVNQEIETIPEYAYFWGIDTFLYSLKVQNEVHDNITNTIEQMWQKSIKGYENVIKPVKLTFYNDMTYNKFSGKDRVFNEFIERIDLFESISRRKRSKEIIS